MLEQGPQLAQVFDDQLSTEHPRHKGRGRKSDEETLKRGGGEEEIRKE